jgi:hypothetical protein
VRVAAFFVAEEVRADDGLYVRGGFKPIVSFDSFPAATEVPLVVVMEHPPGDEPVLAELEVDVYDQRGDVLEHLTRLSIWTAAFLSTRSACRATCRCRFS